MEDKNNNQNKEQEFIETGKIVNTHGMRGEVRLQPWADSPDSLIEYKHFYIDNKPLKVVSSKVHKTCLITAFEGVNNFDDAIKLKNKIVKIKREDIKLEEGTYLITDLIGLDAIDSETGENLGKIADVLSRPASNIYEIKGKREILVPAVPEFIIETNLTDGYIKFKLIEGM